MMLAIGAVVAALQVAMGRVLVVITPLADLAVIALGVALLLGANPFARLPTLAAGSAARGPILSAYLYGLMYGPIAVPCSGPLLIAIFTLSLTVTDLFQKLLFFLAFGLGFGVPLLVIALVAAGRSAALLRSFARHYGKIARVAGAILVVVGLYDLSVNLPFALLYLGA
jgi:cytochrome c-type biogenesis protein